MWWLCKLDCHQVSFILCACIYWCKLRHKTNLSTCACRINSKWPQITFVWLTLNSENDTKATATFVCNFLQSLGFQFWVCAQRIPLPCLLWQRQVTHWNFIWHELAPQLQGEKPYPIFALTTGRGGLDGCNHPCTSTTKRIRLSGIWTELGDDTFFLSPLLDGRS